MSLILVPLLLECSFFRELLLPLDIMQRTPISASKKLQVVLHTIVVIRELLELDLLASNCYKTTTGYEKCLYKYLW